MTDRIKTVEFAAITSPTGKERMVAVAAHAIVFISTAFMEPDLDAMQANKPMVDKPKTEIATAINLWTGGVILVKDSYADAKAKWEEALDAAAAA